MDALHAALHAVRQACAVTRHVQSDLDAIKGATKDDRSPVTVADFAAQAIIARALTDLGGPVNLVGEESTGMLREPAAAALRAAVVAAVRPVWPEADEASVLAAIDLGNHDASAQTFWTLDPVDGTKGFIRGQQYAVSLARIEDGVVRLGVLGCPNLSADFARSFDNADTAGLIFYASEGGGSWSVPATAADRAPQRIQARTTVTGRIEVCESVESAHSKQDATAAIVARLGGAGTPARLDSQCKYAVVARGQADAYMRLPTRRDYVENIWDHAAGAIVATEAGAVVTDITGAPLDFGQGMGLTGNKGVICASAAYHGRIIEAIAALGL